MSRQETPLAGFMVVLFLLLASEMLHRREWAGLTCFALVAWIHLWRLTR